MKHHMPHPMKHMKHMKGMRGKHHMGFGRHHKKEKCLSILTLAALVSLLVVNTMHLREMMMKRKKPTSGMQDKIEHFQRCFERLMEHT